MKTITITGEGMKQPLMTLDQEHGITKIQIDDANDASDGSHTFDELYEHRYTLFMALCATIHEFGSGQDAARVWKSENHFDETPMYEGYFIMGIDSEPGKQISYHLPMTLWDATAYAYVRERAPEWDGHTAADVLERLKLLPVGSTLTHEQRETQA